MNECFASVGKLFNVAYYIVTVINDYLSVSSEHENHDENSMEESLKNKLQEPFLSRHMLGKLNESVVYVVYLLSVLKSFRKNFKHVSFCRIFARIMQFSFYCRSQNLYYVPTISGSIF